MAKAKTNLSKRLLAALLSVVMVFSVIPFSATMALAATDEHPDAVTLTVKDEAGNFIENADVAFTIDSQTNGDLWKSETKQTDKNGCVELLPTADFIADDLTLTATVSKEGFETNETLVDMAITSDDQNFEVVLISKMPTGITAVGRTITYDPALKDIPAVDVQGVNTDTDTVTYTMDGVDLGTEVPTVTNVKRDADGNVVPYVIIVKVEREDKELPFESGEIYTYVNPADIQVDFSANEPLPYNEEEQELVTVEGAENIPDGSKVTWYLNGQVYSENIQEVPKAKAVGEYTVRLVIAGNPNYEVFDKEGTSKIAATEIEGLSAQLASGLVYNGSEQELLKKDEVTGQFVSGLKDGDTVYFMVGKSAEEIENSNDWVALTADNVPVGENAGEYFVRIKVERTNYNPTEIELNPATVTIAKANPNFEFENENLPQEITGKHSEIQAEVNFAAADNSQTGGTISYAIAFADAEAMQNQNIDDYATIDENGLVTLKKQTVDLIVTATLAETDNYNSVTLTHNLSVIVHPDNQGDFILLDEEEVQTYTLGESLPTNKFQVTQHGIQNKVEVFYDSACKEMCNALIGSVTGVWPNFQAHLNWANGGLKEIANRIAAEKDNVLVLTVRVTNGSIMGENDHDFYTLKVSFADFGQGELYTVEGTKASDENEWYNSAVTVKPATATDGSSLYTIATECDTKAFRDSVEFSDQGTNDRYVYLKDNANGAISRVKVVDANGDNLKIDSVAPDANNMTIDIEDLNIVEKIGYKFGFYNPEVNITFTVADEVQPVESGIQKITCFYTKDENAVGSIQNDNSWELTPKLEDGKYSATKTIKATDLETYRGCISFTATDNAGNESEEKCEDTIIVVDVISPAMCADFQLADDGGKYNPVNTNGVVQHYFNGAVDFTLTIKEQNFFAEDVTINVTRDGQPYTVTPTWTQSEQNDEIYYGKFKLSDDGDYVVTVEYTDGSKNVMPAYHSEIITIDTQAPRIQAIPDEQKQNITIEINERNFRASDITVGVEAYDINGNPVIVNNIQAFVQNEKNWVNNGNIHTLVLESSGENKILTDAIYDLSINYNDLSTNSVDAVSKIEKFVVDHTVPTDVKIEYAKSPIDTFLEVITLGFYNPSVTVRFTSYDTSAGVESFTWGYTKEIGASTINHPESLEDETICAVQDQSDKSKFTAEITLTAEEAAQYRGYLSALATDAFQNKSNKKVDNGNIIVVDTIAPEITVEYTEADRVIDKDYYYNNAVDVKFTVTEANFYAEDVVVTVTKNGAAFDYGTITWGSRNAEDKTIGTFTLPAPADHSGDGHYVITVEYTDRSNNEMVKYVSDTHTIDTTLPVINVEYQNKTVANKLTDRDGNEREYFADTQTAVVTITEHNFIAEEVKFSIVAKDVTGADLDADALNSKTAWSVDSTGDVHTITITYPGDANYTFDVEYTDNATNAAEDYATDYFTVDKTDPTNLKVDYSTSVLDTVLESVTFGFYNAKMTVTLTAEDPTSEVHSFLYSYLNAAGVSNVNAELINEAIQAADIEYSADRKTAAVTFEIPKMVLGNDNQFNGTVEFTATDRAGNETDAHKETKRIVVDNIAPTATVQYNTPVNEVNGISYYDGDINATVTITEANFYANDVQVMVAKDGGAPYAVTPSWTDNSVDTHTGTFTLTEDGDYIITINYRDKSTNQMQTYTSNQLTIDTDIQAPTYSINGVAKTNEGGAYKNDATVAFSFEDQNFDTKTIKLERTRFNSVEDVTDEFIRSSDTNKGGSGSFEIPSEVENDGIYVLTISMTDKANHTTESSLKFTINRYGSVYEYSDYLTELLEKQYIKIDGNNSAAITQDLVITEYNANQILTDSLNILITRDGEAIDTQYTSNPTVDGNAGIGESGWYQYEYTIAKENFAEDGVYKITLTSAYAADDSDRNESTSVPENSMDAAGNQILNTMDFTVDTTKPEIRNIVNLDKPIVNAQTLEVGYTIVDVGGLKSIEIIVNGSTIDTLTDFGDNAFNYSGNFTLNESSAAQTVQIKVTDMAGNVTDTASDDFSTNDLYIFNDTITVSTNFFVRWYANQPLFWGSIGGVVVLTGVIWFLIAFKRRKKDDKEAK